MEPPDFSLRKYDPSFPSLLRTIPDCPSLLYGRGQPLKEDSFYIAIVGTRHPSPYGLELAETFAYGLAQRGAVIVSGLAYGIDAAAHRGALSAGGSTVAVLASPVGWVTPRSNIPLAEEILKTGTLLSEYAQAEKTFRSNFPRRNRIVAGMSTATLIIEAPARSGALITARLALEYNRDVCAIPGNITSETSVGTNKLIQRGLAYPVTYVADLLSYLNDERHLDPLPLQPPPSPKSLPLLTPTGELIYRRLKKRPYSIDELICEMGLAAEEVTVALTHLEIHGLVKIYGSQVVVTR
ncbi:DNA-protecting protein DprA [Candidatus Peregrinibacteria bacterium CG_4_9_14_0_2_um_filter_53_11]|nr:MAG: DNA-protecting protein DprA [Candidatus Peregrinibacteria bacterium CG_4_9_14_0_2_um_filter_53_11]